MLFTNGEVIFYGIDDLDEKLDNIIDVLNLKKQYFEVKLIIFEAVNNAFIHGNNRDKNKPISVQWELTDNLLRVDVTDCGSGFKDLEIYKEINEDNLGDEGGRGLYIINCYADEVKVKGSSITMKKYV